MNKRVKMIQSDIDIQNELTAKVVQNLISNHDTYLPRYKKLQDYYEGETKIFTRTKIDKDKPNNKLASGYPSYIVDLIQGMFVGKPISYTSKNEDFLNDLQEVFNLNDEQDENSEITKIAGTKGRAFEIVYIDEEGDIRFDEMEPDGIIVVYDTKITPSMKLVVRSYTVDDILKGTKVDRADVYTPEEIIYYKSINGVLVEVDREEHYFGQIPVIEFLNNDEGIGDFERVITLIDAYDKANSDTANDFEEFTDALLVLGGMPGTTRDDATKLKEDRIILTDGEKQSAYWLIKDINDAALENYKDRLNSDIHKFAKVPDMSDESFAGNASGVALDHKLLALEQVLSTKERKFKRALQKRIKLITTVLNKFDKNYDYTDIDITFTRNKPINLKEAVEIATMLRGFTSMSTALSELPMVDNVSLEQEKISQEAEVYEYPDLDQGEIPEDVEVPEDEEIINILETISELPIKQQELAQQLLDDINTRAGE